MKRSLFYRVYVKAYSRLFPKQWKHKNEIDYWKGKKKEEDVLAHDHYSYFYTTHFDLAPSFYEGKKVLDIGCGPRGSLEWANMAERRVGLDPLAEKYKKLREQDHKMEYVTSGSENIPFDDNYFDVVCSFNSLDHVADLNDTIAEIKRVVKPKGLFLLLTELNHKATACEPQEFSWDIVDKFQPELELLRQRHYERGGGGMYQGIKADIAYDDSDPTQRYGILSAKFRKRG